MANGVASMHSERVSPLSCTFITFCALCVLVCYSEGESSSLLKHLTHTSAGFLKAPDLLTTCLFGRLICGPASSIKIICKYVFFYAFRVHQVRCTQMAHQTWWRWTTRFPREEATPTAGRLKKSLPPRRTMPTVWPGSTTPTWTHPRTSLQGWLGLCSRARKARGCCSAFSTLEKIHICRDVGYYWLIKALKIISENSGTRKKLW